MDNHSNTRNRCVTATPTCHTRNELSKAGAHGYNACKDALLIRLLMFRPGGNAAALASGWPALAPPPTSKLVGGVSLQTDAAPSGTPGKAPGTQNM